ncbi:MAG: helix-turn-helix domain-containing protein [Pirellulaceae bacterium]|nr:helix-turn-helix domain-containing protein [Pirellulaceae bacterium]
MTDTSPVPATPQWRTPPNVAKLLGVDHHRVLTWIKSGKLVAINLADGSRPRYRISADALEDFLHARQVAAAPKQERRRRMKFRYFPD